MSLGIKTKKQVQVLFKLYIRPFFWYKCIIFSDQILTQPVFTNKRFTYKFINESLYLLYGLMYSHILNLLEYFDLFIYLLPRPPLIQAGFQVPMHQGVFNLWHSFAGN